jgi:hypothetical protein
MPGPMGWPIAAASSGGVNRVQASGPRNCVAETHRAPDLDRVEAGHVSKRQKRPVVGSETPESLAQVGQFDHPSRVVSIGAEIGIGRVDP